eukprot:g3545.t1
MDFDRNAIGSLEDVRREWDSLETERAKVEDKLRSFEPAGGRGGGLGGWGVRAGGGGGRGRGSGFGGRGGGGDWSRDRPRDNASSSNRDAPQHGSGSYQASRDKYRAMSKTWERGLDPETAAMDDDGEPATRAEGGRGIRGRGGTMMRGSANGSMAAYQRSAADNGNSNGGRVATGGRGRDFGGAVPTRRENGAGGMRGERSDVRGPVRGDRDGVWNGVGSRGDFDRFRNGGYGRAAVGRAGPRDHDVRGVGGSGEVGSVEPDAKRPRVTSTIVIAGDEETGERNGEMDRWNAEPAPTAPQDEENEQEAATAETAAAAAAAAPEDVNENDDDDDDDNVDYEPDVEPEAEEPAESATSTSTGKEKSATAAPTGGEQPMDQDSDNGGGGGEEEEIGNASGRRPAGKIVVVSSGGPRGRAARAGGVAGSDGGMRSSLASRLGPPMGRPVMVKTGSGDGDIPLAERPMPEPSRPELHPAYKDGDTKKRNRRMFGGLMAHLGRARKQLDHDKTLIEKQNTVAEMAAHRQQQEKRRQRQVAAAAARQERDDELHKRDYINARKDKTLVALHGNAFIANQEQLKGHIFTKTLPQLAWTPNEHTDVTQALLADSNKELDARIMKRKEADDREFKRIDDSVAERAAARARRRQGSGAGERQGRPHDRNADPSGEGNEDRWHTQGAGEDDSNEGPGLSGTRRKRTPEANANGEAERDTIGGSGAGGDGGDDDHDTAAAQPMDVVGPEGGGQEDAPERAGTTAAASEGMEVDEDVGGGDQLGVENGSAEAGEEGDKLEPSPGRAPAHTAGDSNGRNGDQAGDVQGDDSTDKGTTGVSDVVKGLENGGAEEEEVAATGDRVDKVDDASQAQRGGGEKEGEEEEEEQATTAEKKKKKKKKEKGGSGRRRSSDRRRRSRSRSNSSGGGK